MRHTRRASGLSQGEVSVMDDWRVPLLLRRQGVSYDEMCRVLGYDPNARHYMQPMRGSMGRIGVATAAAVPWWLSGGIAAANCVAAYQPIGAASLAASYINLANPGTYDAAPGVAPTFNAATGWTFDGATQYLKTGIVPLVDHSYSLFIQFTNRTNAGSPSRSTNPTFEAIFGFYTDAGQVIYYNGNTLAIATPITSGNIAVSGTKGYRDGVPESGSIAFGSGAAQVELYLGAQDNSDNPGLFAAITQQAVAVYRGGALTDDQVQAVAVAMAAL